LSSVIGTQRALTVGCAGLIVGTILVGTSLLAGSLTVLVLGAVVAGAGEGLSFHAGLGSVTGICPPDKRGAVTSSYFVAFFAGISIPVIGVGVASTAFGLVVAGTVFAAIFALVAAVALVLTVRAGRR
jgi:MFS family permease